MESVCEKSLLSSRVSDDPHKRLMKYNHLSTLTLPSCQPDKLIQSLEVNKANNEMIPNSSNGLGDSEYCLSLPNITSEFSIQDKTLNNLGLCKQKDSEVLSTEYKLHRTNYISLQPRNHNNYYLSISRVREEQVFKYFLPDHRNEIMKSEHISFVNSKKNNKDILYPLTVNEPTLSITNPQVSKKLTDVISNDENDDDDSCEINKNLNLNKLTEKKTSKAVKLNYDYNNIDDSRKYQTDILSWSDVLQYCNEEDLGENITQFKNEYCGERNFLNKQSSLDEIETLNQETSRTNTTEIPLTKRDFPDILFSDIRISDLFGEDTDDNDEYTGIISGDNRKKKCFSNSSTMTEDLNLLEDKLGLKRVSENSECKHSGKEMNTIDKRNFGNHEDDDTSSNVPMKHKCFKIFPCIARNGHK